MPTELQDRLASLQREIRPVWAATEYPPGCNRLALLFLLALKAGGEVTSVELGGCTAFRSHSNSSMLTPPGSFGQELMAILEDVPTLKLAAALLTGDEEAQGVSPLSRMVLRH